MEATFAPEIRMHHATRAKAQRLNAMLEAEYPALRFAAVPGEAIGDDLSELAGFEATVEGNTVWEGPKVPELADLLEACDEAGIDPSAVEEEEEEEERAPASVVPEKYRSLYREVSTTGQGNGDWLYETLAAWTLTPQGKDIPALDAICRANGIDPDATKWGQGRILESRGWKGRYAMSARVALEKPICRTGVLRDYTGRDHAVPTEFLAALRQKHSAALAKEARRAAAEAKAEEAVQSEGEDEQAA